ncbi:unnamed protein product [Effrenium voratum]|nr:unnamed protein product [Effrenium voratum]
MPRRQKEPKPKKRPEERKEKVEPKPSSRRWRWIAALLCFAAVQAAVAFSWRRNSPDFQAVPAPLRFFPPEAPESPEAPKASIAGSKATKPAPEFEGEGEAQGLGSGDIAVLVIATGRQAQRLRQTLQSLLRGFDASAVLVSQAAPGDASRQTVLELGAAWAGPGHDGAFDGEAEPWLHYGRSLEYAVSNQFRNDRFRSLLVVEEDLVFSSSLRSFLLKLEPLLLEDPSIWCISAWNDNGIAPYSSDLSVVMRTESFSGIAWMTSLSLIRQDLLPSWSQQRSWRGLLRQRAQLAAQDCLVPEVSRAAFAWYQCEGSGIRGQCDDEEVAARRAGAWAVLASRDVALGDVQRLLAARYEALLADWPRGQGLLRAQPIRALAQLCDSVGLRGVPAEG